MKKNKIVATVIASVVAVFIMLFAFFGLCIPINIRCEGLWVFTVVACFDFVLTRRLILGFRDFGKVTVVKKTGSKGRNKKYTRFRFSLKPKRGLLITFPMLITLPRCSFCTSLSGVVVWGLGRSPNSKNLCASLCPLCGKT